MIEWEEGRTHKGKPEAWTLRAGKASITVFWRRDRQRYFIITSPKWFANVILESRELEAAKLEAVEMLRGALIDALVELPYKDENAKEEYVWTGQGWEAEATDELDKPETPKAKFPIGARVRSTCEFITGEKGFEEDMPAGWLGTVREHWRDGRITVVMDSTTDEVHTFDKNTDALEVVSDG